ncbi:MAG: 16S rRNA (adenine(1518)-N(6)/adenine(1519)-N(6))-dimethyltransferase RsmA [Lachnospiraceae bacterium]|nr:16S rRNA (adenine(1518)-N(6)/adenine(1519)-N(6))-dimethyltransferase RsmA [Lachnospiraceae bacterium]
MKPYLADPVETKKVIAKYDFAFRKQFGQNFLIDAAVPEAIVRAAGLTKNDTVLEIGPGIGTMTQYLSEAAGKVIAVEIDKELIPILQDTLAGFDNVQVLQGDIMKTDLAALIAENGGGPIKVVANLPYYITTPILMKLLAGREAISLMAVMVQEEVAKRIVSGPGSKDYGALSVGVQYYADPEIVCRAAPSAFMPQPKVASSVLRLVKRSEPPVRPRNEEYMFAVVKAAFLQRRKTLPNALSGYAPLGISRDQAAAAMERLGLDARLRGETLTMEQFAALSDEIHCHPERSEGSS